MTKKIGIIGEYHNSITLSSIAKAIEHSNKVLGFKTSYEWIDTETLAKDNYAESLQNMSGIWSPPGSPFKSLMGALNAIKFARENKIPHLATCAGYQHTIIEYARNVLDYKNANHAEYSDETTNLFIHRFVCSLAGTTNRVNILENTKASRIYSARNFMGSYYCNFGLNEEYKSIIIQGDLIVSGTDDNNAIRLVELKNHAFFMASVFVPQVNSTFENPDALITEFIKQVNKQ
jgi:CTP synthase (UTP-ammonia lyase)